MFAQLLKEEFQKNETPDISKTPFDGNKLVDDLLSMKDPFDAISNMLGINVDEEDNGLSAKEQADVNNKYRLYCLVSKLIHTFIILILAFVVVFTTTRAISFDDEVVTPQDSKKIPTSGFSLFIYKLSIMDTTNIGNIKSIFGMVIKINNIYIY